MKLSIPDRSGIICSLAYKLSEHYRKHTWESSDRSSYVHAAQISGLKMYQLSPSSSVLPLTTHSYSLELSSNCPSNCPLDSFNFPFKYLFVAPQSWEIFQKKCWPCMKLLYFRKYATKLLCVNAPVKEITCQTESKDSSLPMSHWSQMFSGYEYDMNRHITDLTEIFMTKSNI